MCELLKKIYDEVLVYEKDIVNAVHWVYKTAVHGKVSGSKMHKKIMEILAK